MLHFGARTSSHSGVRNASFSGSVHDGICVRVGSERARAMRSVRQDCRCAHSNSGLAGREGKVPFVLNLFSFRAGKRTILGSFDEGLTLFFKVVFRDNDRAVAVAAGSHHSLALTADGSVLSWGSNSHGQLGRKETQKNFRIDIDVPCKAVACGSLFSCAISNTGRVRVWGALQDPSLAGVQPIPRPIPHLEGEVVLRVSCGATHQLITFAEERELPVMKDFCYREQDAAKVASILSQLDQKVPAGFGQHQVREKRSVAPSICFFFDFFFHKECCSSFDACGQDDSSCIGVC